MEEQFRHEIMKTPEGKIVDKMSDAIEQSPHGHIDQLCAMNIRK